MRRPLSPARRALAVIGVMLATAALIGMFLFLPARRTSHRQAQAFDGVVQKKEILSSESRYGTHLKYILIVREETGKLVRFPVPRAVYERARVGMPVQKKAGEPWPAIGQP